MPGCLHAFVGDQGTVGAIRGAMTDYKGSLDSLYWLLLVSSMARKVLTTL